MYIFEKQIFIYTAVTLIYISVAATCFHQVGKQMMWNDKTTWSEYEHAKRGGGKMKSVSE